MENARIVAPEQALNGNGDPAAAFAVRAEAAAQLCMTGEVSLPDAVDELQADATRIGLIDHIGQDRIQQIMAEAFAAVRGQDYSSEAIEVRPPPSETPPSNGWHFHSDAPIQAHPYLIKGLLPQTGTALLAGQWGTYKSTVALDISVSVMTGLIFANRFRVKRTGAVIYLALEAAGGLESRLSTIAQARGVRGPLPFAWRDNCPALTSPRAATQLTHMIENAAAYLRQRFDVPVALIWVDTLIAGAQYAKSGDDNDPTAAHKVMSQLTQLSQQTSALACGIDHFGKMVETGTRGASSKEAHADAVLAVLADRELNGTIGNTRLAVRKQRDGVAGIEIPFNPETVQIGTDEDGEPITRTIIDWTEQQTTKPANASWSKSLRLLRQVLMTALADAGFEVTPFADGPAIRAVKLDVIRSEFYRQYPADGDAEQKTETRRKAFYRVVKDAQAKGLVATREIDGVQLIWLTRAEAP